MSPGSYEEVRKYRDLKLNDFIHDHFLLNKFHDEIMQQVVRIALRKVEKDDGLGPAPFSFFVMGSAGRFEQGLWSDQDHGIIYEETNTNANAKSYFLHLGSEISKGLYLAGYEYCSGDVMASNPTWCKSRLEWQQQISCWVQEANWESIRNLLIFIDSRSLYGEKKYIEEIKNYINQSIHSKKLLPNIFNNTMYYKKGIGILGQLLIETHGIYAGQLNLKETTLFPFVNAIRFLAIRNNIIEASTLTRIDLLPERLFSKEDKEKYKQQFIKLLNFRLLYGNDSNYEASHFLNIMKLSKVKKKEIKEIIKTTLSLCYQLRRLIEKEGSYGDE
ncbi:DUF294 nucleotidyltransferase-like domain-containing protein [Bacillus sp. EB600]|uniref:DUF294 nucleotidyltransferase-like domain-containing protein n=1 Tax=Bacillus sp. EB600 TaxID=2806345 RepID=UPI00210EA7EF|nr:DUF294 nucleotidyltransferase-like domain-containing protein [Bacillus sp. EB600]MCQ6281945.1 hypothetical protein [Bacillus sp. EB600]